MDDLATNGISGMFGNVPQIFALGISGVALVFSGLFLIKIYWRMRGNTAFKSYQIGVVAPVQYGDRGADTIGGADTVGDVFVSRLDELVEREESYEMSKLLPQARELEAIKKAEFHTAPVLEGNDVRVLELVESVVQDLNGGFRVLVNASLEKMVEMDDHSIHRRATRLPIAGIALKFAVVDRFGRLVMAVEHMGEVPLVRKENITRTIVIEVLRKAGVWYLEVPFYYSAENARAEIRAVLRGKAAVRVVAQEVA